MSKVEISHVENGYIITYSRMDMINGRLVTVITIHPDLDAVIAYLKQERI